MEFFNTKRWLGVSIFASTLTCITICACSSDDESLPSQSQSSTMLHLNNGECIELEDTITHSLDEDNKFLITNNACVQKSEVFNLTTTRVIAGNSLRAYGYDTLEPESGWKKYYLDKWDGRVKYQVQIY